jgi:hypothetical protein
VPQFVKLGRKQYILTQYKTLHSGRFSVSGSDDPIGKNPQIPLTN